MTRRRTKAVAAPVVPYACPECDQPLAVSPDAASCPAKAGGCGWRWVLGIPVPTMRWDTEPRCPAAAAMVKACGPAWRSRVTAGRGYAMRLDPDRPNAPDGSRPMLYRAVPVLSESVRLAGPGGWRAVVVWLSLDDGASWSTDECLAWPGGLGGRPTTAPTPIPVLDLRALVALPWAQKELTAPAGQTPDTELEAAA